MRVIENNNTLPATCPHCESQLGIEIGDIQWNEMPHRHVPEFQVTCAACDHYFGIDKLPRSWVRKIVPED